MITGDYRGTSAIACNFSLSFVFFPFDLSLKIFSVGRFLETYLKASNFLSILSSFLLIYECLSKWLLGCAFITQNTSQHLRVSSL